MRLAVITGCVYLVLTGIRWFFTALCSALGSGCEGCSGCGPPGLPPDI